MRGQLRGGKGTLAKLSVLITTATLFGGWKSYMHDDQPELSPSPSSSSSAGWNRAGNAHFVGYTHHSRQLLFALPNCTPPAIENFPNDVFTNSQRRNGGILLHILVALYSFVALAYVCDDYFVPACERTAEVLNMEPDVAGATLMAAGSSAPELATAVIGVFIAKDDIGVGSVVGSAVFNIMFVISICALFAGKVVTLHWWPLARDCFFYSVSIITLAAAISDGYVQWYEAIIFLLLYILYILFMLVNARVEKWIVPKCSCCKLAHKNDEKILVGIDKVPNHGAVVSDSEEEVFNALSESKQNGVPLLEVGVAVAGVKHSKDQGTQNGSEEPESPFAMPDSCLKRFLWTISLPVICLHYITIPDCRRTFWKNWFVLTFIMSCVWISLYSYVMVWMITVTGYTFGIPDTIMGLTFIAAGVSVPDAIASLIVCKEGFGDMAVSNAVGSNVFDILLCLGLPWFIKTVIINPAGSVEVYSEGLVYSTLTLLLTVLFLLLATHFNGWKLDRKYGVILILWYLMFMVLSSLYELNIFAYVHPPECFTSY